jgi:hypothetical protein
MRSTGHKFCLPQSAVEMATVLAGHPDGIELGS